MNKTIDKTVFTNRFEQLDQKMEAENLDAMIIYGKGAITYYGYLYYFANYYPVLRPGFVVKLRGEDPVVFYTTRAEYFLAKENGSIDDVRYIGIGDVVDDKNGVLEHIASFINEKKPAKTGICGLNSLMTFAEAEYLKNNITGDVVDATLLVQEMKAVKTEAEIDAYRETFAIAEKGFNVFEQMIKAGVTSAEIGAEVDRIVRQHGAVSTLVFVEEGPYFLRKPTTTPLSSSGLVTAYIEMIGPNGDWIEKAGLFALGELTQEQEAIGNACVASMNNVKNMLKPGVTVGDIANVIKDSTKHLDVNQGIWHGHGVGVDHDIPIIRDDGTDVIEPRMLLSVHPNISNKQETIGASIADVFVITETGAESLSTSNYDIKYL